MTLIDVNNVAVPSLSPAEFRQYKVICAALWCFYNQERVHYSNARGSGVVEQLRHPPPAVPANLDCSSFVHWCFAVAGSPDPSGGGTLGSKGGDFLGDTSTLWPKGRFIGGPDVKPRFLLPGDLCFYSYGQQGAGMVGGMSEHVAIHISGGNTISHGSEEGPKKVPYNQSSKPLYGVRRYEF